MANQSGKKTTKTSSIPTVTLDTDDTIASAVNGKVSPTINLSTNVNDEEEDTSEKKERVTMPTNTAKRKPKQKGERAVADISEMATPRDPNNIPGVDVKVSPQDEILKPGGPFDKYVENKKAEYYERMAYEDQKREIEQYEAIENGEQPVIVDEEGAIIATPVDNEEAEILSTQAQSTSKNFKVNSVIQQEPKPEETKDEEDIEDDEYEFDDEDLDMTYEDYEVTSGSNIQYEPESTTPVDDNEPIPFYTGLGIKDDYPYPDEYDIPSDEELFPDMDNDEEEDEIEESVEEFEDIEEEEEEETEEEEEDVMDEAKAESEVEELVKEEEDKELEHEMAEEESEQMTARDRERIGSTRVAFVTDENSFEDLEKEIETDNDLPTEDERLEELKVEIAEKIRPKARNLNLSGFTVANKSTASNKILEMKETSAGKWVLPTTGITYQIREISGQKLEYLREQASTNTPTAAKNVLQTIYDHIITPKPTTMEQWAKSIAYADYDHLYMGIYLAAFADANYMPMTCEMESGKIAGKETGCGKMFLTENLDIMSMVKFKDDECKDKFWELYNSDRTNSEGLYASEIIPISDKFAISFCEPTLYSVMLENNSYGREFSDKYSNLIAFMPYIDNIYWIDYKRNTLVPISYQQYDNNASKTAKSKVIRYSNIFDTFTTDEYSSVVSIINGINENTDWFTYIIPEMTCPECGRTIPEETLSASGLVFTRHRLGILATTSTK